MSTAVAEFPALKDCVARILLSLAAQESPNTYGCRECADRPVSTCADHSRDAAVQERLERAAAMAARAETRDDLDAALAYACQDRAL
jgi:hypothetical protein